MRIAFCSSEVFPFAKTGGLADVCGALPLALKNRKHKVCIFMPLYKSIDVKKYNITKVGGHIYKAQLGRDIDVFFVKSQEYFHRDGFYGDGSHDYADNLKRFQFFCEQVLMFIKESKIALDIIHCHDWQTALIPVYLKEKFKADPIFKNVKSILTIHNLAFQGVFPKEQFSLLGLSQDLFRMDGFEFYDQVNLLKSGILHADEITTVSPQYAREIQTKEFGCALDDVLKSRDNRIEGILNGLDHDVWNPKTDERVIKKYSRDSFKKGKAVNKKYLQESMNFAVNANVPLFGFVGRLSHQKGVALMIETLRSLEKIDAQAVIQGVGEKRFYTALQELQARFPKRIAVRLEFNESLAHHIYAGVDMFLMPSVYEPCGLSQMISLYYGTIPIVFKTGGLVDTIHAFDERTFKGNGFVFDKYTKENFLQSIEQAIKCFHKPSTFERLIQNAFACDFSWGKSAQDYERVYRCLLSD